MAASHVQGKTMTISRRKFVAAGAALTGSMLLPRVAMAADTIKLGSILDTSGIFDAYGKPMNMAMRLAVDQINADGGLLGKQVEVVSYDTQSDMALYSQYAQQLTRQDKVDVVHGGILSASREAIRQTMHKTKTLYFYNVLYEGGVCDRNIFINGVTPAQQVEALVPYAMGKSGKKVYILAADYNYGHITAKWIQKFVADNGGETVGVDFFPLDVADFGSTIAKIQTVGPDLVIAPLVGGAHLSFFRQWAAAGMKDKIALASTTLGVGNEHKVLTAEEGNGIMVAYNYSQEDYNQKTANPVSAPIQDAIDTSPWIKSSVSGTLIYDTIDDRSMPREGIFARMTAEFAGLGGDAQFAKVTGKGSYYKSISDYGDVVGMLSAGGGYVTPTSGDLRVFDQLFVGGETIRGFKAQGIGPRDQFGDALGGTTYFNATAEIGFPIPIVPRDFGLRGAVFADAATLYGSGLVNEGGAGVDGLNMEWRASVGGSLIWASPFGPLRFDLGFPVVKEEFDETQVFRFGTSGRF